VPAAAAPTRAAEPAAPPAQAEIGSVLDAMIGLCQTRPSLAAPLRAAAAHVEGQTLVLEVPADFVTFAKLHSDEYRDLARKAAGKPLAVTIQVGSAPAQDEGAAAPGAGEVRRLRLREEAEREPAVQEALDLFEGRVVDVREAKPSREDS